MGRSPESPLRIEVCWDAVVVTVTVAGELDVTTAPRLAERLLKVANAHPERLVLDLDGLVFLDVAGVRVLDSMCKVLEAGCPVIIRNPHPSARETLRPPTGLMDG